MAAITLTKRATSKAHLRDVPETDTALLAGLELSAAGSAALYTDANTTSLTVGRTGITTTVASGLTASDNFSLAGQITPAQITANQNNYNPASLATASTLRLSSNAARTITGLVGGVTGRLIVLMNVGSFSILLSNEDALSTASNRFTLGSTTTLVSGAVLTIVYDGTTSRWRAQAGTGGAGGGAGSLLQAQWLEVSVDTTIGTTTWPTANTIARTGVTLPTATIAAASTTDFAAAGSLTILTTNGLRTTVAYTSKTGGGSPTFNGCTGGTGSIINTSALVGSIIYQANPTTTIAAGSNGVSLPTGTINVASTTGFPASGQILVVTSLGSQLVTYTGVGATTFTGCTGGLGVMSTGGAITNVTTTAQDLLRVVIVTVAGSALIIQALGSISNATNNADVHLRLTIDGTVYRGGSTVSNGGGSATALAVSLKVAGLGAGAHTIALQWRVGSGTGQVRPSVSEDENASLLVQEVSS